MNLVEGSKGSVGGHSLEIAAARIGLLPEVEVLDGKQFQEVLKRERKHRSPKSGVQGVERGRDINSQGQLRGEQLSKSPSGGEEEEPWALSKPSNALPEAQWPF